jgi:hypothetical protein
MTAATEAPVSGRVEVTQRARDHAADYQDHARGYACSAPLRDGRADDASIVQAFARFERDILASLQQPQPVEGEAVQHAVVALLQKEAGTYLPGGPIDMKGLFRRLIAAVNAIPIAIAHPPAATPAADADVVERAARIADEIAERPVQGPEHGVWERSERATAKRIAAQIRKLKSPSDAGDAA